MRCSGRARAARAQGPSRRWRRGSIPQGDTRPWRPAGTSNASERTFSDVLAVPGRPTAPETAATAASELGRPNLDFGFEANRIRLGEQRAAAEQRHRLGLIEQWEARMRDGVLAALSRPGGPDSPGQIAVARHRLEEKLEAWDAEHPELAQELASFGGP